MVHQGTCVSVDKIVTSPVLGFIKKLLEDRSEIVAHEFFLLGFDQNSGP